MKLKPYLRLMRLDKPIGSFLLLWPTLWALWIASQGTPNFKVLTVFILGVIVMRSAGCVINDIADQKFDSTVARTRCRPLVTGEISTKKAVLLFLCLCLMGFLLVLQLNILTIKLSFVALVLASFYPFMKRITHLPQVFLGAAFSWSIPMAFAALTNAIPPVAWLLYTVAIIWPIAYDSIYALMDREDDMKIGVKSTAILFGKWDRTIILLLQLLFLSGLFLIGIWLAFKPIYFICLTLSLFFIVYQIRLIQKNEIKDYFLAFYSNTWMGCLIFIGIFVNYAY